MVTKTKLEAYIDASFLHDYFISGLAFECYTNGKLAYTFTEDSYNYKTSTEAEFMCAYNLIDFLYKCQSKGTLPQNSEIIIYGDCISVLDILNKNGKYRKIDKTVYNSFIKLLNYLKRNNDFVVNHIKEVNFKFQKERFKKIDLLSKKICYIRARKYKKECKNNPLNSTF